MRKTKAEAQATKQQLLDAALDAFYEHGVAGTSLQAIAKRAGVTRGAFYWHFKNKEDLFDVLLKRTFEFVSGVFSDGLACADKPGCSPLKNILTEIFRNIQENEADRKLCIILNLKCEHIEANRAIIEVHQKYSALWEQHFRLAVERAVRLGTLPADLDIDAATLYLQSAVNGLFQNWLHNQDWALDRLSPIVIDTTLFALQHCPTLRRKTGLPDT